MFWIGLVLFLMAIIGLYTTFGLLFDLYMKLFGIKVIATVEQFYILDKSLKNNSLFTLKLKYSYIFNDTEYNSSFINSFFDLTRVNKHDLEKELNIVENKITVYVSRKLPCLTH